MIVSQAHPISIKTLSLADLGLAGTSHQTHIGLPENFQKDWKKFHSNKVNSQKGFLAIKDSGIDTVAIYTNSIISKNGNVRSPKIISTNKNTGISLPYESVITKIRQAKAFFENVNSEALFIFCSNVNSEPIVIIVEFNNYLEDYLKDIVREKKISTKLILPKDNEFQKIFTLSQQLLSLNNTGLKANEYVKLENQFKVENYVDARLKIDKAITLRQGQYKFRKQLLQNYNFKCCVSGCNIVDVLEACHIYPYRGLETNHPSNGIILRSDLHTLFDRSKIAFSTDYRVLLDHELKQNKDYGKFNNKKILLPNNNKPSHESLKICIDNFNENN